MGERRVARTSCGEAAHQSGSELERRRVEANDWREDLDSFPVAALAQTGRSRWRDAKWRYAVCR